MDNDILRPNGQLYWVLPTSDGYLQDISTQNTCPGDGWIHVIVDKDHMYGFGNYFNSVRYDFDQDALDYPANWPTDRYTQIKQSVSSLKSDLSSYETATSAQSAHGLLSSATSALSNSTNSLKSDISSLSDADYSTKNSLQDDISSLSNGISSNFNVVTSLHNANYATYSSLKSNISDIQNNMSSNVTKIFKTDNSYTTLVNNTNNLKSSVANLQQTNSSSITSATNSLQSNINNLSSQLNNESGEFETMAAANAAHQNLENELKALDKKFASASAAKKSGNNSGPGVNDPNVYGVRSSGGSDPTLTRTDASVGLVAGISGDHNDFDTRGPWAGMHKVNDAQGNVFVYIPKFYIRKTKSGSGDDAIYTWQVSCQVPSGGWSNGWYRPACFWNYAQQTERPGIYVGAYDACDNGNGGIASKSDTNVLVNTSLNDFRSKAQSLGRGYQLMDIHVWDVLQTLMTVEFATFDLAALFGINNNGGNYSLQTNGQTDALPGSSNSNANLGVMNYRGIENAFTNVFQWTDGVNEDTNDNVWICDNPDDYQSSLFSAPYQESYQINNAGNVSEIGYDPSHPELSQGITYDGSYDTYFCADANLDYGSGGDSAWYLGGAYDDTSCMGAFGGSSYYPASTIGDVGSRLVKEPM